MFFDTKECEWADMQVLIAGFRIAKFTAIRYKYSKNKEAIYGEGDEAQGIQSGNRAGEGEIKVYKGALDDMNRAAKAAGGLDALDLEFDIIVTYRAKGARKLQIDTLTGVQFKDFEKGWEQGSVKMDITMPIIFLRLRGKE